MKKFLICLSLLFSFIFISSVKADNYNFSKLTLNNVYKIASKVYTPERVNELKNNYYIYAEFVYNYNNTGKNILNIFFLRKTTIGFNVYSNYISNNVNTKAYIIRYNIDDNTIYDKTSNEYTFSSNQTLVIYHRNDLYPSNNPFNSYIRINSTFASEYLRNNYSNKFKSFTSTDDWNFDSNYKVNFHLNGGTVWDLSNMALPNFIELDYQIETTTDELEDYLTHITPLKDNHIFMGWYYDENLTQPFDSSNELTSDIDLYAKWVQKPNITFHLNGGYIKFNQSENEEENNNSQHGGGGRHDDEYLTEDFTRQFNSSNDAHDFISSFTIHKSSMQFAGFYYDMNFKTPYNPNDNLEGNINLYAKWRYENVEDFLNTTTFNSYTFDTNYQYAIITRGNNTGDIYLGLNVNRYDITVYQYDENINDYHNSNEFCLIPMYSKDSNYYYLLNDTMNDYINVLVLPKETFDTGNYNFYLTDNAYITYTDNLDNAIIYDSNGEEVNTNLSDRYNNLQDSLINDEKDLLTIFKNLLNFKDNRVLSNINTVWNKLKATPIYIYFMILIVGGLIILIIKSARRN